MLKWNEIKDRFISNVQQNGVILDSDTLNEMFEEVKDILTTGKDWTKEELVSALIEPMLQEVSELLNDRNTIPGYTIGMQVGNIKVFAMEGSTNYRKDQSISEKTLYDIASCTKLYTEMIAYNLIAEGVFDFHSKIKELDARFHQIGDLTVEDILQFHGKYQLNRIEEASTSEEAFARLFDIKQIDKDGYLYQDFGLIILKEMMETVTQKTYEELLDKYILSKLNLHDTFLHVPKNRRLDITGTANFDQGLVNDPKAVILGGYSGHAGIFATAEDLLKTGAGVFNANLLPKEMIKDIYMPNSLADNRGVMGNTYIYHPTGLDKSFVSNKEPRQSFKVQGSTRTIFGASAFEWEKEVYINSNTILFNPSSMEVEHAYQLQKDINRKGYERSLLRSTEEQQSKPFRESIFIKDFSVNRGELNFRLIDPRQMVKLGTTSEPVTEMVAKNSLKLMMLATVLKEYDSIKDHETPTVIVKKRN